MFTQPEDIENLNNPTRKPFSHMRQFFFKRNTSVKELHF